MRHPLLYEINTRPWLRELSKANAYALTLVEVPDSEFSGWQRRGFTHIWLMGCWTSGPRARAQALTNPALHQAYSEALPGWLPEDVTASPYAISEYRINPGLGGENALKQFRQRLQTFGLKLLLDFVPNHVGLDHPWVMERPDLLVQSSTPVPGTFSRETPGGKKHLAYGKDPNWPAWTDTVQLDYRRAKTHEAMKALLLEIASLCDGVRCDMAMLLLNDVFGGTWKSFPTEEPGPRTEFWADAIALTRRSFPEFLFLAEVYWGLETRLQSLGFDYTYDKALYDKLVSGEPGGAQRHLLALSPSYRRSSAHFLENHDEPRVASILPTPAHRAAALVILGLPGMRFLHEGQLCGLRNRLPVQLARRAQESGDPELKTIYDQLLTALHDSSVGQGNPELLIPVQAWRTNPTTQHFILVQWTKSNTSFDLVVVNLAPHRSQCFAPVKLPANSPAEWNLIDLLGKDRFIRTSEDLNRRGLYLDLPAHGTQILHFEPLA
jgi:hypothetical protein